MLNLRSFLAGAVLASVVGALVVRTALSQDPVMVTPDLYKVLLENQNIRVLEVTYQPGQSEGWHSHPRYFFYVVEPGKLRSEPESGEAEEFDLELGLNGLTGPVSKHSVKNVGDSVVRLLAIELKP